MPTLRTYLEPGPWPVMRSIPEEADTDADYADFTVRVRSCGDNCGDAECPFCDTLFHREGEEFNIGDRCRRCPAICIDIEES